MDHELQMALDTVVVNSVAQGRLPAADDVSGAHALDVWRDGPNGAMLFWLDQTLDCHGDGKPVLYEVFAEREEGDWRAASWSSATSEPVDQLLAGLESGLHRISGGSAGRLFVTCAIATPEVALVRLCDEAGRIRDRRPGKHGFVLLGVTSDDPLTSAYAVDHTGKKLPGAPLTLWAPPHD